MLLDALPSCGPERATQPVEGMREPSSWIGGEMSQPQAASLEVMPIPRTRMQQEVSARCLNFNLGFRTLVSRAVAEP